VSKTPKDDACDRYPGSKSCASSVSDISAAVELSSVKSPMLGLDASRRLVGRSCEGGKGGRLAVAAAPTSTRAAGHNLFPHKIISRRRPSDGAEERGLLAAHLVHHQPPAWRIFNAAIVQERQDHTAPRAASSSCHLDTI